MERIRLLLLDHHVLFRESLSRLLAAESDFEIVGQCGSCAEAIEKLRQVRADIVLLDFDLGHDRGNQFISSARRAGYAGKILAVTEKTSAAEASSALQLGASGIFLKHNSPGSLVRVIRSVAAGELFVDQKVIHLMADGVHQRDDGDHKILTPREQQVLQLVLEGLTNKRIAERLGVSEGAVKATLQRLFRKRRVRTRSQLVRVALEDTPKLGRKSQTHAIAHKS
jgi:DNA-binding NarL/FixJ family response regulator